jgi:hypothetical protein
MTSLSAAEFDGRLEPFPRPGPPFEYAAGADIFYGLADIVWELDERGLPPGFPSGFPVPDGCPLVMAQRGKSDSPRQRADLGRLPVLPDPRCHVRRFGSWQPSTSPGVSRQTWLWLSTAVTISEIASSMGTQFFCAPLR